MQHTYPRIGPLTVLQSEAGFYIGRVYFYSDDEYVPYSRESNYFHDKEAAKKALIENEYIERY